MAEQKITRGEEFQRFIEGINEGDMLWTDKSDTFSCHHRPKDSKDRRRIDAGEVYDPELGNDSLWRFDGTMRFFIAGALRLRGLDLAPFTLLSHWNGPPEELQELGYIVIKLEPKDSTPPTT